MSTSGEQEHGYGWGPVDYVLDSFVIAEDSDYSPGVNTIQNVRLDVLAVSGTFTLAFGDDETAPLAHNISLANLVLAVAGLDGIGTGNVQGNGTDAPKTVGGAELEFIGDLAGTDVELLVLDGTGLTVVGDSEVTLSQGDAKADTRHLLGTFTVQLHDWVQWRLFLSNPELHASDNVTLQLGEGGDSTLKAELLGSKYWDATLSDPTDGGAELLLDSPSDSAVDPGAVVVPVYLLCDPPATEDIVVSARATILLS